MDFSNEFVSKTISFNFNFEREREREDLTKFLRCKIDIQDILLAEEIFFPLKERP